MESACITQVLRLDIMTSSVGNKTVKLGMNVGEWTRGRQAENGGFLRGWWWGSKKQQKAKGAFPVGTNFLNICVASVLAAFAHAVPHCTGSALHCLHPFNGPPSYPFHTPSIFALIRWEVHALLSSVRVWISTFPPKMKRNISFLHVLTSCLNYQRHRNHCVSEKHLQAEV